MRCKGGMQLHASPGMQQILWGKSQCAAPMSPAQRYMPRPKPDTDCGMTSAAYAAGVAPMQALATA